MPVTLPLPPPGAPAPNLLAAIADVLEGLLDPDDDGPSVVTGGGVALGAATSGDGIELATKQLDAHPAAALLGFVGPEEWLVFGVVTRGTSRALPGSDTAQATAPVPAGTRLGLVHLVARDGRSLSRVVPADGDPIELTEGAEGTIHDTCRRVLGLATDPPACSPLVYWANCWLEAVVAAAAAADDDPLDWPSVALLHPAIEIIERREPELTNDAIDQLEGIGRVLAAARSWEQLRVEWATGSGHAGLSPAELAWMDEGIFARWCLGTIVDPERLLARCRPNLTREAVQRLRATLAAWHLPQPPYWREPESPDG